MMSESLEQQFEIDRNETTKSTVCQYGDKNMSSMELSNFLMFKNVTKNLNKKKWFESKNPNQVIDSRDTYLYYLLNKFSNTKDKKILNLIMKELNQRETYDFLFKDHFSKLKTNDGCYSSKKLDTKCLKNIVDVLESNLGKFNEYGLKYIRVISELCMG